MARRNRAEIVVDDEIGVYHCVQRVVRRAFLCGEDSVSGMSYEHRREWIRDRLEGLARTTGHSHSVTWKDGDYWTSDSAFGTHDHHEASPVAV